MVPPKEISEQIWTERKHPIQELASLQLIHNKSKIDKVRLDTSILYHEIVIIFTFRNQPF